MENNLAIRRPVGSFTSSTSTTTTATPPIIHLVPLEPSPLRSAVTVSGTSTVPPQPRGGSFHTPSFFLWNYASLVSFLLVTWVLYLLLPRGVRKAYFRAQRKRYARPKPLAVATVAAAAAKAASSRHNTKIGIHQTVSIDDSVLQSVEQNRRRAQLEEEKEEVRRQQLLQEYYHARGTTAAERRTSPPRAKNSSNSNKKMSNKRMSTGNNNYDNKNEEEEEEYDDITEEDKYTPVGNSKIQRQSSFARKLEQSQSSRRSVQKHQQQPPQLLHIETTSTTANKPIHTSTTTTKTTTAPSPRHPALHRIPDATIIDETLRRLKARGIRLQAHGVQCDPKQVWLRVDLELLSLEWRTEFPRAVTNQSGETSTVLMRGNAHRIALPNILYIDVGKKTAALQKATNDSAPATLCFSLLTQTGSLDLQTKSQLERDALVSSFSLLLDQVHPQHDWRSLYEQSPAPSAAAVSNISSQAFPEYAAEV